MHNEVRDLVAECLREAKYPGVEIEPQLQPLSGESFKLKSTNLDDEASSDVKCLGFWRRLRQAFFDCKVMPEATSPKITSNCTTRQSNQKIESTKIESTGSNTPISHN